MPIHDNVVDDKNRVLCKYITFTDDLIQEQEKQDPEKYMSYFDVNQHESNMTTNKSFMIKIGKIIFSYLHLTLVMLVF